jgi:broad specificity phosphatase PhoE
MSDATAGPDLLGEAWLVRHGETEWSRDHRHTSTTDLPLTEVGTKVAHSLAQRLAGERFDLVLTSPRRRARTTAELAGFPEAEVDEDLVEWDYGDYEGITTVEIRETVPGWTVWTHPTPGGETAAEVAERLDRVVARLRGGRRTLVFGHGHALRALTARWLGQPVLEGRHFVLDTATVSVLGHERDVPAVLRWNS